MSQSRFIATSLKEVAAFFGVQQETVRSWIKRGCPAEVGTSPDGGKYDLAAMIRWCRQHVWVPKQNGAGGSSNREATKDKLLQIELAERTLGLKQKMGEVVEKQTVLVAMAQAFSIVRARLEAIPVEAASAVPADLKTEVIAQWQHLIHMVLKELESHAYEDTEDATDERRGPDSVRSESENQ